MLYGVFEGLDVGIDRRGPVLWDLYQRRGAFAYGGSIREVSIEPAYEPGIDLIEEAA